MVNKAKSKEKPVTPRRSQAERREETSALVCLKASEIFAAKGYAATKLEDIAHACNLTIRPIYHYYGNKKQLFQAVVEAQELRLSQALQYYFEHSSAKNDDNAKAADQPLKKPWQIFMGFANDTPFRQIVLIDSPNVLGRERWAECSVVKPINSWIAQLFPDSSALRCEIMARMLSAALAEVALMLASSQEPEVIEKEIRALLAAWMPEA